ncbi:hypothetical protein [Actinophytocola sediminis]
MTTPNTQRPKPSVLRRVRNREGERQRLDRIAARDGARARLVAALRDITNPTATPPEAQEFLEQAQAWTAWGALALHRYLDQHPDALRVPPPDCPLALARLLLLLAAAGHPVTAPACSICGRSDRPLECRTPVGRCCNWCKHKSKVSTCARCGQEAHVVTRKPEGPICRRCYASDEERFEDCIECGRRRQPTKRRADGAAWCETCAPKAARRCIQCGDQRPAAVITDDGAICRNCYRRPPRRCGVCGHIRPIRTRAIGDQPDRCAQCYKQTGRCVVCERVRPGSGFGGRGGAFHCTACRPRGSGHCDDCGQTAELYGRWPRGYICCRCAFHRLRNPSHCPQCDVPRVLVGRSDTGEDICGPCAGSTVDFTCRRCGQPGRLHTDSCCARCVVTHRVYGLLGGDDGTVAQQLQPLAQALTSAQNAYSVLNWLYYHPAAALLADLAAQPVEITHALLDGLPPTRSTLYVRDALIATGALPSRAEHLNLLESWADRTISGLPKPHQRIVRPFAEWHVIRDARRRHARNRYTEAAAAADRTDIRTAIAFLDWLEARTTTLDTLTQDQLDCWLDAHPTRRQDLVPFVRWAGQRRLTDRLELPAGRGGLPVHFLTEEQYRQQLRRCLNDETLPREVRIAGSLVRLYGLPISRIVELTADRLQRDNGDAFLILAQHPVLLPPKLAALIDDNLADPSYRSMVRPPNGDRPRYLLPASQPGKPRSARATQKLLRQHGLPTLAARNTAMIEAVGALPPIVIADLFGIHPGTAHSWAKYAQTTWTDYLAADTVTDQAATRTNRPTVKRS